jgi:cation diffusion facilitator CzcD-associated flavoprotein CzcO
VYCLTSVCLLASRPVIGPSSDGEPALDAVIVGAGFSGLYMLHRLRSMGMRAQVLERGDDAGGTWYWNRYPGARCDLESVDYQFSFSEELLAEWRWTERYATQPEILAYLNFVADRLDLRRDIQFGTEVRSASFDDGRGLWRLTTGSGRHLMARFCILAVGCLSEPKAPEIPGIGLFAGEWYHTARWPHEGVDFTGKRVGVIGTGSSAIQLIPKVAAQAAHLYVFQRTPNYAMPAHNRPLGEEELAEVLAGYGPRRRRCEESDAGVPIAPPTKAAFEVSAEERAATYEAGWRRGGINALSNAFTDIFTDERANATAQEFARRKIRRIVKDPRLARLLSPTHHIGTKRTCVEIGYFATYNRANVELVDVSASPIREITPRGPRTAAIDYEVDALIFATGFDAMTGALLAIDVQGSHGAALREHWSAGPRTYLGLMVAGFPNLFMVTGPQSPSVLSNMVVSIEQHVDWIADRLRLMHEHGFSRVEATQEAEDAWVRHVCELAQPTLYPKARSWYVGANVPGKPRVFMPYVGGCGRYRKECEEVVADGHRGLVFDSKIMLSGGPAISEYRTGWRTPEPPARA